ncbi:MAG: hypothetical protein PHP25_00970 [Candidatus Moranbacteria bacterium]|nr:hypothetical protein [Candidatus Moranbacteria bacterium]
MLEKEENLQINEEKEKQDLDNLVGFFDLLLKIDMRINPDNYKQKQSHD